MDKKRHDRQTPPDRSLTATGIFILFIFLLLIIGYSQINAHLHKRAIGRMEESVNTVITEITAKFMRDSRILNATADIISQADDFDQESMLEIMESVSPLLETMKIRVLLPNDQVLTPGGGVTDVSENDNLSFADEVSKGEHVTNRVYSVSANKPMLRHFVPIIQDGKTAALLYGVTMLEDLPASLNIDNIYNATASVYIIDTKTGDFILDTYPTHTQLGNILDFNSSDSSRKTKGEKNWDESITNIMALGTGYVVYRTRNTKGWEYMYYAPANINQWAIAVSVPEKEAFSSVFVVRNIWIIMGVILAAAVLLYYIWVSLNAKRILQSTVEHAVLTEKLQKAEAADRAKSTFLSNMSHDIRTPMNAIIGFTTLAQTNLDNPQRVSEYLAKILSSSNHLLSLINDVLDMSRIESGKLNIEEKECSISDIFRDMRNIIHTQMQSKQLNFYMDTVDVVDEDIYCDKLHVNQVLLNLLSNAIKFTPAGGTVALTVTQKPVAPAGYGSYEIRVKDTGIGMSPEFAEHIFEPFERERNTTVSGIQGTGLGMAISKNIVDAMGGTIEVHSEQGKGTEFVIHIDFRLQSERKPIEVIRELEGLRALVVDDSFSTCDSVCKMLHQIGMRPEWTMHGQEAVLRAKQAVEMGDEYCSYIIDWLLPDLGGLEVVRQIRAIASENTPIIIVSAYDWSSIEDEARKAGATDFCSKPIFMSELRDKLAAAVSGASLPSQEQPAPHTPKETFSNLRLLVVEDNELNREIAEELLQESGFAVETAEDGTVAVDMVKNAQPGHYALILMDIQMPRMNGYDAAKAIRSLENPQLANIPIVAMTANAFEEDRQRALSCGMNAHVSKPINLNQLIEVLKTLLK